MFSQWWQDIKHWWSQSGIVRWWTRVRGNLWFVPGIVVDVDAAQTHYLEEYEDFVTRLMSPQSMESFETKLGTAGLGLAGEGGEFADLVKKLLFHGREFDDEIRIKMIKELGDIMFYVAFTARHVCDSSLQEIIDKNIDKLQNRYSEGHFTAEEAIHNGE